MKLTVDHAVPIGVMVGALFAGTVKLIGTAFALTWSLGIGCGCLRTTKTPAWTRWGSICDAPRVGRRDRIRALRCGADRTIPRKASRGFERRLVVVSIDNLTQ